MTIILKNIAKKETLKMNFNNLYTPFGSIISTACILTGNDQRAALRVYKRMLKLKSLNNMSINDIFIKALEYLKVDANNYNGTAVLLIDKKGVMSPLVTYCMEGVPLSVRADGMRTGILYVYDKDPTRVECEVLKW